MKTMEKLIKSFEITHPGKDRFYQTKRSKATAAAARITETEQAGGIAILGIRIRQ